MARTRSGLSARGGARLWGVLGWALAAVLAGAVAWWAVAIAGGRSEGGEGVLTRAQVTAELAAQTAPTDATSPASPTSPGPTTTATPSASPPPREVVRTWAITGGTVGAACQGRTIALVFATPAEGWTVEAIDPGPDQVEVDFRRGESETGLRAWCSEDGVPVVEARPDDRDDD